jgi:hypothetical protein
MEPIDWCQLGRDVRLKHGWDVDDESFGTEEARAALCELIGDDAMRAAVDYYVDALPAGELARCALMILRPAAAVERCLEIYRGDPDPRRRVLALEALRWTADSDVLPVLHELYRDPDPAVQRAGVALLDQLLWTGSVFPDQGELFLRLAEEHANPYLPEAAAMIRDYLARRGDLKAAPAPTGSAEERCAICGAELEDAVVIRWESLPNQAWHASCESTDEGRAWFEALRQRNPPLDRQVTLRTLGLEQRCTSCGTHHFVNPTATGHDPTGWSVNCGSCGEAWIDAISGSTTPGLHAELMRLRLLFETGAWGGGCERQLLALDARLPSRADRRQCRQCGGRFSFSARVRCLKCRTVLPIDSWLHTAWLA